jgi:hypothetical protein
VTQEPENGLRDSGDGKRTDGQLVSIDVKTAGFHGENDQKQAWSSKTDVGTPGTENGLNDSAQSKTASFPLRNVKKRVLGAFQAKPENCALCELKTPRTSGGAEFPSGIVGEECVAVGTPGNRVGKTSSPNWTGFGARL